MTRVWRISVPLFSAVLGAIVFLLLEYSPLRLVENAYEDHLIATQSGNGTQVDDIVVLEIRESTFASLPYRSPIDREFLADLINRLSGAGAKAIGVDIIFDQETEVRKDRKLRSSLLAAREKTVVALATEREGLSPEQVAFQTLFLEGLKGASVVLAKDWQDGVVRHYALKPAPQFAWTLAGKPTPDHRGSVDRIYYLPGDDGTAAGFKAYPAEAALVLPDDWFRGKYVLIGTNVSNIDQFRTPFVATLGEESGIVPGVHIHAHILNQLLSGKHIFEVGILTRLATIIAACMVGCLLSLGQLPLWGRSLAVGGISLGLLFGGWVALEVTGLLMPMVAGAIGLMVSSILASLYAWQKDLSEKRFIKQAWSRYVSKDVVEELIRHPERLRTGGERVDASFIFTDIAGFTRLSEALPADTLGDVINGYLDLMTREFEDAGATLDKIVGDAIVGFLGAPIPDVEHPDKAVALALRLERASRQYQSQLSERGIEIGITRIGVNTGTATVGNFGGSGFFDYTAVGDAVNTASRLENANKRIGSRICVSGDTARRAIKHNFRPVGHLYVEGKANSVEAWEPVTEESDGLADLEEYQEAYHMLETNSDDALKLFRNLNQRYPGDYLVEFHLGRLEKGVFGSVIEIMK